MLDTKEVTRVTLDYLRAKEISRINKFHGVSINDLAKVHYIIRRDCISPINNQFIYTFTNAHINFLSPSIGPKVSTDSIQRNDMTVLWLA